MIEYEIIAMRRSGHHAVANWIGGQLNEKYVFLNNLKFHPIEKKWKFFPAIHYDKNCNEISRAKTNEFQTNYIISGLEDENLKVCDSKNKTFKVIVLRDIYNLFASRLKRKGSRCLNDKRYENKREDLVGKYAVDVWKEHAGEFIKKSDYICINFNKWFSDVNYRKKVSGKLELDFNDKGKNIVANIGEGSSFDKTRFNNKANQMKVLERYKEFENDESYKAFFKRFPDLLKLNDLIFNK